MTFRIRYRIKQTIVGFGFFLASCVFVVLLHLNTTIFTSATNASTSELLANPSLEGIYRQTPANWGFIVWGNSSVKGSPETHNTRSGLVSQKVSVTELPSGSGVIWKQNFKLRKGHLYEMSVWLRSTDAVKVQVLIRKQQAHYQSFASQTLKVGKSWQKVTIKGGVGEDSGHVLNTSKFVDSYVGINFKSTGNLWIDDVSLKDITNINSVTHSSQAVPASFFGMHINKWGTYQPWPTMTEFGLLRLWDTRTNWRDINPTRGSWNWSRLDYYVNSAIGANPDVSILYTLGQTPLWASSRHDDSAKYGLGASSEPADIRDWRNYVNNIANRYKGKIKYWEIWNEADFSGFYKGSVAKMVQMSRIAYEELKKVDPTNIVLSPNITVNGLTWFDEFLSQGGGQYFDVMSFHYYFRIESNDPEYIYQFVESLRSLLISHGLSNKPLWNTEGCVLKTNIPPNTQEILASIPRILLTQWALGIESFSWYAWDIRSQNRINLSTPTYDGLSQGGIVYREIVKWLKGAKLTYKNINGDTWLLKIERNNGYVGHILWNRKGTVNYQIPNNWQIATKHTVQGKVYPIAGVSSIEIGKIPILLVNR